MENEEVIEYLSLIFNPLADISTTFTSHSFHLYGDITDLPTRISYEQNRESTKGYYYYYR